MKLATYSLATPDCQIEDAAALIAEIGYTGVEWTIDYRKAVWDGQSNWHIDTEDLEATAARVRDACQANGLEVVGTCAPLGCYDDPEKVRHYLNAAALVGATGLRVFAPYYDGSTHIDELFASARRNYEDLIPLAREAGVKMWSEIHAGRICASAAASFRLLDGLDPEWVGAIHDSANMIIEGFENWQMGVEMLGPYLHHVHVKNLLLVRNKDGSWGHESTSLAAGAVDWPAVIAALKSVGYDGYLSIEDMRGGARRKPVGITTREKLQECYDFLAPLI
jgi:sugar phosphate isomerase/epimerase